MGNQFKNVAVIGCLKTFLFVFNTVLWLAGLVLLLVGVWMEIDLHKYVDLSPEFSGTAPHVIVGIAGLIILISSAAFPCIIKGQPVLLYIYGAFLACVFVMDAGVGATVACYRYTFAQSLRDGLTQSIEKQPTSLDLAQSTLHCCGVSNYTDWIRLSPQRMIPISCCINPSQCVTANYSALYEKGCYEIIVEYLESNINLMIGVAIGSAVFPLVGTILSCCLATFIKKSKYDVITGN